MIENLHFERRVSVLMCVNWNVFFRFQGRCQERREFSVVLCLTTFSPLLVIITRVEVPEIISAEQRCFIVLTFFSADSEDMKKISADQLFFGADQLWFSLNQRCSELKNSALIFLALKHWIFSAEQRCFSADLLWISSDINTCR